MISNIIHFIWINERMFGRQELLCLKSALKNTSCQVMLHTNLLEGEAKDYCPYQLKEERLTIKYQPYSCYVKGIKVRPATLSDILRIQILQEYGGIYSDMDMLWLNEFPIPLDNVSLVSTWENQSYKIVTNSVIAAAKGYDFSSLLLEFDAIFDKINNKKVVDISGESLKEHLTLFKPTGDFLKAHSDVILKKANFNKNNWRLVWKFLTGQVPEEKLVVTGITGIHLCGCGLFGEFKIDTRQLIEKHSKLKAICDALVPPAKPKRKWKISPGLVQ